MSSGCDARAAGDELEPLVTSATLVLAANLRRFTLASLGDAIGRGAVHVKATEGELSASPSHDALLAADLSDGEERAGRVQGFMI